MKDFPITISAAWFLLAAMAGGLLSAVFGARPDWLPGVLLLGGLAMSVGLIVDIVLLN